MNHRTATVAFLAVIAAIVFLGPLVSFLPEAHAAPVERWAVKAPAAGAKVAPTLIVTGANPDAWPLDYVDGWAKVGAPCDCYSTRADVPLAAGAPPSTLCHVRKQRVAACEVAK